MTASLNEALAIAVPLGGSRRNSGFGEGKEMEKGRKGGRRREAVEEEKEIRLLRTPAISHAMAASSTRVEEATAPHLLY